MAKLTPMKNKPEIVIVRKRGVIVIPKTIREALGIVEGDMLRVSVKDDKIILSKESFWEKLFNTAKGLYSPDEAELELDVGEPN
jgi:AbrB family looped-hinge helix DNA binding protein